MNIFISRVLVPVVRKNALKKDIQEFVAKLVAKGSQWRFPDALEYVKEHAVMHTTEIDLVEPVQFMAKCVCMDPVNVDQALNVVYAFLTGNDHCIKCGSLHFKDDFPTVFIAGSGGGKSPLIIKLVLEQILSKVQAIVDRIPGGLASFVTAGSNYPGWLVAVTRLVYRCCFLWEELFFGINKAGGKETGKMSLEENFRCYNSMAVGGDLRATVDRELQAEVKSSLMAGLQYKSFHEYLAGDTKGALERMHYCLSDVLTAKRTEQEYRMAEKSKTLDFFCSMITHHVEFMFPAEVMDAFTESLKAADQENESGEGQPMAGAGNGNGDDAGQGVGVLPEAAAAPGAGADVLPNAGVPTVVPPAGAAPGGDADALANAAVQAAVQAAGRRRQRAGQAGGGAKKRPKAAPKSKARPKVAHVVMPPCGRTTTVDDRSMDFLIKCCNYYREALPDSYASHPVFASGMKIDQSMYKFVGTRCRRRESFLKALYPETWTMSELTHPVDCGPGVVAARCDFAMRFAVYNELEV